MSKLVVGWILLMLVNLPAVAGDVGIPSREALREAPTFLQEQFVERTFLPAVSGDLPALDSPEDWREVIDATWGEGLPTADKLAIFDAAWHKLDEEYACFQGLKDEWDQLGQQRREEIEAGVSAGRFAAILNHMAMTLRESHTVIVDPPVNWSTWAAPGVPLMLVNNWGYHREFGACLTPLEDGSLLVYDVGPSHPLQLEPGDRVLGYDGQPWRTLYRQLLRAELPLTGWWGSSESSFEHAMLMSAGRNWHLFETIDIVRHATGETVHLPTNDLYPYSPLMFCSEQLDLPGVPKPDYANENVVSWGIVDGSAIGYIYVQGWFWDAGSGFRDAVTDLMFNHDTKGLIIDFRLNFGGNMGLSNPALAYLFDRRVTTIGFAERSDPDDHLAMRPSPGGPISAYVIPGQPYSYYDRPIAVLVGPGAVSSGDQVALRMTFHPRARTFGKSTATAFNAPAAEFLPDGYRLRFAKYDAFLVSDPDDYLTHDEFVVDEPVWLEPGDVANGIDTVVQRAMEWIIEVGPEAPYRVVVPPTLPNVVRPGKGRRGALGEGSDTDTGAPNGADSLPDGITELKRAPRSNR